MALTRRKFVHRAGIGVLSFYVAGCRRELTPEDARREDVPLRVLSASEAATLEKIGEVLVPGSAAAGLIHFIDHQLGAPPAEQLLMIRYLGVPAPFVDFYRAGAAAANAAAGTLFGRSVPELNADDLANLVANLAAGEVAGWEGPPAGFFYFVLRSDAVDVVYGTQAGFAALDVPYAAHIEPPSRWGE